MVIFHDRQSAGQLLAEKLTNYSNKKNVVVLGIPRGGVVVGAEIAKKFNLPLDVLVTRKIGDPLQPELAVGSIDPSGCVYWDEFLIKDLNIKKEDLRFELDNQKKEIKRRLKFYKRDKKSLDLKNKTIILTDDGIATGATAIAAINYLKTKGVMKIILAVPIVAEDIAQKVFELVDEMVVLFKPEYLGAVGKYYQNFEQVSDEEVVELLSKIL